MKIGLKILISGVAALAASAVIGWVAFGVLRELQAEFERIDRLTEITDKTHALHVLTSSFKEESLRSDVRQAKAALASLDRLLDMSSRAAREQILIEQLHKSQEELGPLIEQWFISEQTGNAREKERREMLASQIRTQVQFISDDTRRLRDISQERALLAQKKAAGIIVVLIALLALTNGVIYLLAIRSIVRSQRAVMKNQERLQRVLEVETVGVMFWDLTSGRMTDANDAFLKMMGYSRDEVEGGELTWQKLTPPEFVEVSQAEIRKFMATGRVGPYEKEYFRKDGTKQWLLFAGSSLGGNECVEFCVDISARKKAEEALRRSDERQGYLLRLGDALRPLKRPVDVQEAAARVLGEHLGAERVLYFEVRGPDYVVERDYAKGVPPLRGRFPITAFGPKLWEAYQAGRTVVVRDVETDASVSPEERPAYAAIQIGAHVGVPLVKEGQFVAGLAAHAKAPRDWTAEETALIEETAERTWAAVGRARAEEALRESEESYRTLFSSIDEGFCVIEMLFDEEGRANDWRFLEVNPAFARHNGLVQATGKTIRELTPDIEPKWFEVYGNVALTGRDTRFVESSEALNRWFDLYAFRVGEPKEHKVAVLFTDITARKQAEAELARHREDLEKLVAERTARLQDLVGELEHFSYTITHDLKSPLRAMRGFAEMASLACEEGGATGAKEFLQKISTAAERMDKLIADALNYSRSVRQELPVEDVNAGVLLRGMLDSYPDLQAKRASIRVDGPLPMVLANEAGLTQVFSNLLGNAVKFVRPGEKPEIRIWATPRDGWVRIWVEDKGIGVSKEMLPRVFDMFARGSKAYEGTGIGLALVRKVVQRMGGKVGVESEEGKGSRFWVELKRGEEETRGVVGTAPPWVNHGAGTVLYVEDEEGDALFMSRAFEQRGLAGSLQVVGDGRAAIDYLSGSGKYGDREKHPLPTLVLLDLNLPQVSGFGVLEWMRNNPDYARLPVVVFSSSTRADDRIKATALGADEFLTKPSSGLQFGDVVEKLRDKWMGILGRGSKAT